MAFVNLTVKTEKRVFAAGTVGGNWKFWIIDPDGEIISGPQETPSESIVFFVDDSAPTRDQVFTAGTVRVDVDGNDLGPVVETPFTLVEDTFVIIDVAGGIRVSGPSAPSGPPDNTLPEGGRPDAGLPSGRPDRPDNSLPNAPVRPSNGLPNAPVRPDAGLPIAPVRPGNALPGEQPGIDNTLPGGPPDTIGNQLPPNEVTPQ